MLDEIIDANEGCQLELDIKITQHEYRD